MRRHASVLHWYTCKVVFFDNFPMFADSFSVLSIHCVARELDASFLYKCPASHGGSLRQHGLLFFWIRRCPLLISALIRSISEIVLFPESVNWLFCKDKGGRSYFWSWINACSGYIPASDSVTFKSNQLDVKTIILQCISRNSVISDYEYFHCTVHTYCEMTSQ